MTKASQKFKEKIKRKKKEEHYTYPVRDVSHYIIVYSNKKDYGVSNLKLQKLLYKERKIRVVPVQEIHMVEDKQTFYEELQQIRNRILTGNC